MLKEYKTMQHCPVCNFSLDGLPECPRCRSDLSLLQTIQTQSRQHLITALQLSVKGDKKQVTQHINAAKQLNNDQLTHSIERVLVPRVTRLGLFLEVMTGFIQQRASVVLRQANEIRRHQ